MPAFRDSFYRLVSWSPLLFLGALAALTWWLDTQIQTPTWGKASPTHIPQYFFRDANAVTLDKDGHTRERLSAGYAEQFLDDESVALHDLKLTRIRPNLPPETVTARDGTLTGDRKDVYLRHDVVLKRQGCAELNMPCEDTPLTLSTDYLHYKPDSRTMTSDQKVTVTSPSGTIEAVGVVINDIKHTIDLHSEIRGVFNPSQIKSVKKP